MAVKEKFAMVLKWSSHNQVGYSKLVCHKQLRKALLQLFLLAGHWLQKVRYKFVFD